MNAKPRDASEPLRVLLVHESWTVLETLSLSLMREGLIVTAVNGVEDAFRELGTAVYDAVVVDLDFRGETGEDLVRFLCGSPGLRPLRVLALATPGAKTQKIRATGSRVELLERPFTVERIAEELRKGK